MGRRPKGSPPAMRKHRTPGGDYAYVEIDGKQVRLGSWGSAEARREYAKIIREWEKSHPKKQFTPAAGCRIPALVAAYDLYLADRVSVEERGKNRRVLAMVIEDYGDLDVDEFGKAQLKAIRQKLVDKGRFRTQVNKDVGRIRRCWKYGVEEDLVEPATLTDLQVVSDLKKGKSAAKEGADVLPVPLRDMMLAVKQLRPKYRDMALLQFLVGMRPGELAEMRPEELHKEVVRVKDGEVRVKDALLFAPARHKNLERDLALIYVIGPRAQRILEPWLAKAKPGKRIFSTYFTYYHLIEEACAAAGVPKWSPGRLRHNFLSRWSRRFGIEMAGQAVMHTSLATTALYVQRILNDTAKIAKEIG